MSKILPSFTPVLAALTLILQFFTFAPAQAVDVRIRVDHLGSRAAVQIDSASGKLMEEVLFLDTYGPERSLGRRMSNVRYFSNGKEIQKPGGAHFDRVEYAVDLTPRQSQFAWAHISWGNTSGAQLMLDDILPQRLPSARITITPPAGWLVAGNGRSAGTNVFTTADPERAAVFLGPKFREIGSKDGKLRLVISGEWLFSDQEAYTMAGSLLAEFERQLGALNGGMLVRIARFPSERPHGEWEADTRGRTLNILSSDMPFKNQSVQRLHEQLRHELIHLWIPNELRLTGSYDWFYEGFAMYQSLKTGVAVGQLRFEDMLSTLSRAFAIDGTGPSVSLLEASRTRWQGSDARVYARGMAVAFLTDVALLDASGGKRSSASFLRSFLDGYRGKTGVHGSEAAISLMRSRPELVQIVDRFVTGAEPVRSSPTIGSAGLNLTGVGLTVSDKPSRQQKKVLEKLGINAWRNVRRSE